MMSKRYELLEADMASDLETAINKALKNGAELHGDTFLKMGSYETPDSSFTYFYQAVLYPA